MKNDYFETVTIVDPLELPEQVQSGLRMTSMTPTENCVAYDFSQQVVSNVVSCSSWKMTR